MKVRELYFRNTVQLYSYIRIGVSSFQKKSYINYIDLTKNPKSNRMSFILISTEKKNVPIN